MVAVLSLTLLGFFLGMRHATDPDHVIAGGTIMTRQPTVRAALLAYQIAVADGLVAGYPDATQGQ